MSTTTSMGLDFGSLERTAGVTFTQTQRKQLNCAAIYLMLESQKPLKNVSRKALRRKNNAGVIAGEHFLDFLDFKMNLLTRDYLMAVEHDQACRTEKLREGKELLLLRRKIEHMLIALRLEQNRALPGRKKHPAGLLKAIRIIDATLQGAGVKGRTFDQYEPFERRYTGVSIGCNLPESIGLILPVSA